MVIHWHIPPNLLEIFLQKWRAANPPIPFLRRGKTPHPHRGATARAAWLLTEAGRADLEEWRKKGTK